MNNRIFWTDEEILLIQANLPVSGSDLKRVEKAQTVLPLERRRKLTEQSARKVIEKKIEPPKKENWKQFLTPNKRQIGMILGPAMNSLAEICEKKSKKK